MSIRLRLAVLLGLSLAGFAAILPALSRLDRTVVVETVFIAGLIGVMIMVALHAWILRPLGLIDECLATNNPQGVEKLRTEKTQFGNVARFIFSAFEQRDALQREMRERAIAQAARERCEIALQENLADRSRLGCDLHDGVIQSLYAAGMELASIRMLLRPDQTEAATRIEHSRAALNETIHDLRNFLIGLEPESLKSRTFTEAVAGILEMMQGMRPFVPRVEIDEVLAARLTLAQRVHALQITREAVSNALRHGEANRVSVVLRLQAGRVEFEVADDGRGFEAGLPASGNGLANFARRARELGAELMVRSEPGGTRVQLTFSVTKL